MWLAHSLVWEQQYKFENKLWQTFDIEQIQRNQLWPGADSIKPSGNLPFLNQTT